MFKESFFKANQTSVNFIINFFTAQFNNDELYKKIKEKCKNNPFSTKDPNKEIKNKLGYLTIYDCTYYYTDILDSYTVELAEMVVSRLHDKGILINKNFAFGDTKYIAYQGNKEFVKFLLEKQSLDNYFYGFEYIASKYRESIVKIEVEIDRDEYSIGTGFIVSIDEFIKPIIVTNKHVAEHSRNLKIFSNNGNTISYEKIKLSEKEDIAIIILDNIGDDLISLKFYNQFDMLQEVMTVGYPRVAMTKDSYQLYHKGEINSFVEDYSGNRFLILSAKTSPGNSGGPVLNELGMVIGIVTQDFFEQRKETFIQTSYAAAIPAAIMKILFQPKYQIILKIL